MEAGGCGLGITIVVGISVDQCGRKVLYSREFSSISAGSFVPSTYIMTDGEMVDIIIFRACFAFFVQRPTLFCIVVEYASS